MRRGPADRLVEAPLVAVAALALRRQVEAPLVAVAPLAFRRRPAARLVEAPLVAVAPRAVTVEAPSTHHLSLPPRQCESDGRVEFLVPSGCRLAIPTGCAMARLVSACSALVHAEAWGAASRAR